MYGKRLFMLILVLLGLSMTSGCAMLNKENRVLLNSLDDAMKDAAITRSTTGKIIAAPVAVPVGLAAGAVDAVVLTPGRAVGPAWKDTRKMIWEDPKGSDIRQIMLIVPKVVSTAIVFTCDWTMRSLMGMGL